MRTLGASAIALLAWILAFAQSLALLGVTPAAAAVRSKLVVGDALSWPTPCPANIQCNTDAYIVTSPDGTTKLAITGTTPGSSGGVLTLTGPNVFWSSGVQGAIGATMQADGNFVVFGADGNAIWNSGTSGHPGAILSVDVSEVSIVDESKNVLWRQTYSAAAQCLAAMQEVQVEKLTVTLASNDRASFAAALRDPTVAQCEKNLLAAATASLPGAACTLAQTMPLDPVNSPKAAAANALQQTDGDTDGQFYTMCYSPYIAELDHQQCVSYCANASNRASCNYTSIPACEDRCFQSPAGPCPTLHRTVPVPVPINNVH
jgi:hypothetical protein